MPGVLEIVNNQWRTNMIHQLIAILIVVAIAGLIIYLMDELPVDATVKKIGKIVAIIVVILYFADRFLPV